MIIELRDYGQDQGAICIVDGTVADFMQTAGFDAWVEVDEELVLPKHWPDINTGHVIVTKKPKDPITAIVVGSLLVGAATYYYVKSQIPDMNTRVAGEQGKSLSGINVRQNQIAENAPLAVPFGQRVMWYPKLLAPPEKYYESTYVSGEGINARYQSKMKARYFLDVPVNTGIHSVKIGDTVLDSSKYRDSWSGQEVYKSSASVGDGSEMNGIDLDIGEVITVAIPERWRDGVLRINFFMPSGLYHSNDDGSQKYCRLIGQYRAIKNGVVDKSYTFYIDGKYGRDAFGRSIDGQYPADADALEIEIDHLEMWDGSAWGTAEPTDRTASKVNLAGVHFRNVRRVTGLIVDIDNAGDTSSAQNQISVVTTYGANTVYDACLEIAGNCGRQYKYLSEKVYDVQADPVTSQYQAGELIKQIGSEFDFVTYADETGAICQKQVTLPDNTIHIDGSMTRNVRMSTPKRNSNGHTGVKITYTRNDDHRDDSIEYGDQTYPIEKRFMFSRDVDHLNRMAAMIFQTDVAPPRFTVEFETELLPQLLTKGEVFTLRHPTFSDGVMMLEVEDISPPKNNVTKVKAIEYRQECHLEHYELA